MFEQSIVEARTLTSRPWTLAVSVCGQAILVTAAIVLPLLHPETMRRAVMLVPIGGPPTEYKPAAPKPVDAVRNVAVQREHGFAFIEPVRVPNGVDMISDSPSTDVVGAIGDAAPGGVPGGMPGLGGAGGGTVIPVIPPPSVPTVKDPVHHVVKETPPGPPAQVRRGGEVQASLLTYRPEPVYPPLAKHARISGTVRMSAIIATDGKISSLRVLSGHPLLVASAVDAVKRWVYSPTLLNNVPVEVITEIIVTFTLN